MYFSLVQFSYSTQPMSFKHSQDFSMTSMLADAFGRVTAGGDPFGSMEHTVHPLLKLHIGDFRNRLSFAT
jgi:hypothetical protein